MIGMHDLRLALIPIDVAGYEPALPLRQKTLEVIGESVEVDQRDLPRRVEAFDPVGNATIVRGRRLMAADRHFEGDDALVGQVAYRVAPAAIEEARGEMEEEIDNAGIGRLVVGPRGEKMRESFLKAWPHAFEARNVCKQRIENGWPHKSENTVPAIVIGPARRIAWKRVYA